ncbi:MAG: ComEC/Rec2 family competence protein [Prevotella sp.]|nr:ComEC/Rec2 family competence protein [Prevotella sp.]
MNDGAAGLQLCPFLRVTIAFILGILLADWAGGNVSPPTWLWMLAGVVVLTCAAWRWKTAQSVAVLLSFVVLGAWIMSSYASSLRTSLPQERTLYKAILTSEPVRHGKVIMFDAIVAEGELTGRHVKVSMLRDTVVGRYLRLHVGDGYTACSRFERLANYHRGNFDYVRWLEANGFSARTFVLPADWRKDIVSFKSLSSIQRLKIKALKLRRSLLGIYRSLSFSDDQYALLSAMTLGDKSSLTKELRERFSQVGVAHVLALSGLHLGIVYFFLSFFFRHSDKSVLVHALLLLSIWAYVMLAGLPAGMVRSAVMLTVYAIVAMLRRQPMSLNTLSMTAFLMLVVNPCSLWDVSFQMSFMSVLGIVLYYRPVYTILSQQWLQAHPTVSWIWSMLSLSVAAQIGVAPLVAYYFGQFSTSFALGNLFAVPLTTLILYLSPVLLLLTPLHALQAAAAMVMKWLTSLLTHGVILLSTLPFASVNDIHINAIQVTLLYVLVGIITALIRLLHKGRRLRKMLQTEKNDDS